MARTVLSRKNMTTLKSTHDAAQVAIVWLKTERQLFSSFLPINIPAITEPPTETISPVARKR